MELREFIANIVRECLNESVHENKKNLEGIIAYHRSYNKFDKFDTSKIVISGRKKPINGWGFYFSDDKNILEEYGNYLYQVTLFKNQKYFLIDLDKPLEKDLIFKIIKKIYKNKKFDVNNFNLCHEHYQKTNELKNILYDKLKKINPSLEFVGLSEIIDVKNKNTWFYIDNYTETNDNLKKIFDEFKFSQSIQFNDCSFDIFSVGNIFYKNLSIILGGDKNASIFLSKNGVDGLKKSMSKNSNDYIIFNPNSITIEKVIKTT
jgi:hypothetical protein